MKKYLLFSLLSFTVFALFGQGGMLQHYQRKVQIDDPILACMEYNSSEFDIIYHDSIYNEAEIKVKKCYIGECKKVKFLASMKNGKYTKIVYLSKKKNRLIDVLKSINRKIVDDNEFPFNEIQESAIVQYGKFYQIVLECKKEN